MVGKVETGNVRGKIGWGWSAPGLTRGVMSKGIQRII